MPKDNWAIHWLKASGNLQPWSDQISTEIERSQNTIEQYISPPRLDVLLLRGPEVIPEIGMAGEAFSPFRFSLTFDPGNPNFETCLTDGTLQRQVAHEVHHCMRKREVRDTRTLGEMLVREGLAGHFVRILYGNSPEP